MRWAARRRRDARHLSRFRFGVVFVTGNRKNITSPHLRSLDNPRPASLGRHGAG